MASEQGTTVRTHNEILALHRDALDDPVLVGPDCPQCLAGETLTYACNRCDVRWRVPGVWRWSWRREAHYHDPHLGAAWHFTATRHIADHADCGQLDATVLVVPSGWFIEQGESPSTCQST